MKQVEATWQGRKSGAGCGRSRRRGVRISRLVRLRLTLIIAVVVLGATTTVWADEPPSPRDATAAPVARASHVQRDLVYAQRDTGDLRADLYVPQHPGPHPCVLMIHGGAWLAGVKEHTAWHARHLAGHGMAVLAIDYRLAPFHTHPAQLNDCRTALDWLDAHADEYDLDRQRLAICGYSAGGQLACLLATAWSPAPDQPPGKGLRVRGVVAGGAPCDFQQEPADSRRLAFWLGGSRSERPDDYRDASPAAHVTAHCPPIFLYHGRDDRVVPVAQAISFYDRLHAAGVTSQLHLVPQAGHLRTYWNDDAFAQATAFLRHCLELPPTPALDATAPQEPQP